MSAWKTHILEDVIGRFIDYRGKTPRKVDSGVPLITAKIIKQGKLLTPTEFIAHEDYSSWMTRGLPEVDDLVLTVEAPLGEVALIKDRYVALAQRVITMRGKKNILFTPFLKFYFQSEIGQHVLQSRASGTTVFGIKAEVLRKVPVLLPTYAEQQAIADVLSSLDAKIDLLHRQNTTLESMAETLFHQWFIEEAREEWESKPISYYTNIQIGRTPPRKESQWFSLNTNDIKWISIRDLGDSGTYIFSTNEYLTSNAINKFNIPIIPNNTVILSFKLTIGRVSITTEEMVSNEAIAQFPIKYPDKIITEFLYLFLKSFNYYVLGNTSSIATAINSSIIKSIPITVPDIALMSQFNHIIKPYFIKIKHNAQQIQKLEQLRDTLLPKLMSGEVRVVY